MGDKIRSLIEEGQRALGKEVVVMNDNESNEEGRGTEVSILRGSHGLRKYTSGGTAIIRIL